MLHSAAAAGVTDEQRDAGGDAGEDQPAAQRRMHLEDLRVEAATPALVAELAVNVRLLRRLVEVRLAGVGAAGVLLPQLALGGEHVQIDEARADPLQEG